MLEWLYKHSSSDEFLTICTTLWAAWFVRNKQVFEGGVGDPVKTALSFNKMAADYNSYSTKVAILPQLNILSYL